MNKYRFLVAIRRFSLSHPLNSSPRSKQSNNKSSSSKKNSHVLDPQYKFKCGLEIHCQLRTQKKLFSGTNHKFNEKVNSMVSYFDAGLPGTQPRLNPEAVLLALIAGVALNAEINHQSTFDRKHYFYSDQPSGYQITQHYNPICLKGQLKLVKPFDDIDESEKIITFDQLQIEQDTGKSVNVEAGISTDEILKDVRYKKIDLNRANVPLIEAVTNPDFDNIKQVQAFVKKFQLLMKFLKVSTGELETGAMRVDVNISVNGGHRVEIKNLSSSHAIVSALEFEYRRQVKELKEGHIIVQETRGWDGFTTTKLRVKESIVDYRYMPDPELSPIYLSSSIEKEIREKYVNVLPDEIFARMTVAPYNLRVVDVRVLLSDKYPGLFDYYMSVFNGTSGSYSVIPNKASGNYVLHELIGEMGKAGVKFDSSLLPSSRIIEILKAIHVDKIITNATGKLILKYLVSNIEDPALKAKSITDLVEDFGLKSPEINNDLQQEIEQLISDIISQNQQVVQDLKSGKNPNSVQFLIGQAMRATQGKIPATIFADHFKRAIYNQE